MSLIEEALRKQREETERTQPGAHAAAVPQGTGRQPPAPTGATPPAPPSLPVPPDEATPASTPPSAPAVGDQPEKNRKTWRLLVGLGVLLLIAVVVLLGMFVFGVWLFKAPVAAPGPGTVAATSRSTTGVTARVAAPTPAAAATAAVAAVVVAIAPTSHPPARATGAVVVAIAPAPPQTPVTAATVVATSAVVTVPPVTPPAATTTVEVVKVPIVWPRLTVSGFMGGGRTVRSTVIINGQMLTQGDTLDGAKVVTIDKRGVTLSFSGETRTLAVGTSTE